MFESEKLSHRGLCVVCGAKRMQESARQLQEHKGPIYEVYKSRHKAAMSLRAKKKE